MQRVLLLLILAMGLTPGAIAQTYSIAEPSVVSSCSGTFEDSNRGFGGTEYDSDENLVKTFCAPSSDECIQLTFTFWDVDDFGSAPYDDYMIIYDGPSTAGLVIYNGQNSANNDNPGTVTSTTGCLTVQFISDNAFEEDGWSANISCTPCTPVACSGTTPTCASIPDDCASACDLGGLNPPAACPSNNSASTSFCLNNIGATAENPYLYLTACNNGSDMSAPAADVWYQFSPSTNMMDIFVRGLNTPNIAIYEGPSCDLREGRGCAVGSNGIVTTTFSNLTVGGNYYLQISGGDPSDQGEFEVIFTSYNDCDPCNIGSTLTANPPPSNGRYGEGTVVTFTYNVYDWNPTSANWLHGVVPKFGPGWDMSTLTYVIPPSCDNSGEWGWYNSVTSSENGTTFGPGFFYDSRLGGPRDGNPGNNYGDGGIASCRGSVDFTFEWSIQVGSCTDINAGDGLNVTVQSYGDGQTGSWTSLACTNDASYDLYASATCCEDPLVSNIQGTTCGNTCDGTAKIAGQGYGPWTYVWVNDLGATVRTISDVYTFDFPTDLCAGTYVVTVSDIYGCAVPKTVIIPKGNTPTATVTGDNNLCLGSTGTFTITLTGNAPFSLNLDTNGTNFTKSVAGLVYTLDVTETTTLKLNSFLDAACLGDTLDGSATITFANPPNAQAGLDQSICGLTTTLSALSSFGNGNWIDPTGTLSFTPDNATPNASITSPAYGTYTLTWREENVPCPVSQDDIQISFYEQPVADAGEDAEVCGLSAGLIAIPSAGNGSWQALDGGSFSPNNTQANVTANVPTYGDYRFVWKEENGACSASAETITITYTEQPVADAGGDFEVCGLKADLNASPTVGNGYWTGPGVFNDPFDPNTKVSVLTFGTRTFTWNEANGSVCPKSTDEVQIKFTNTPAPTSPGDQEICGTSGNLNVTPSVGVGWCTGPGTISDTTDPNTAIIPPNFGEYVYTWYERNSPCPVQSIDVKFTFVEQPVANAGSDQSLCDTLETKLIALPSVGDGNWSGIGTIVYPDSFQTNIAVPSYGTYSFQWEELNASPCVGSQDMVDIQFVEQPKANAGADSAICGTSISLYAAPSVGAGKWHNNGASFSPDNLAPNATATVASFGFKPFVWEEVTQSPCVPSLDTTVIHFVNPVIPEAGPSDSVCGLNYTLAAVPSFGWGTWSETTGAASFTDITDPNTATSVASYGKFTYRWLESNSPCASNSDLTEITYFEQPVAKAGPDQDICGLSGNLNADPTVGKGRWIAPAGITITDLLNPNSGITAASYGSYDLIWEEVNGPCTVATDIVTYNFFEAPVVDAGLDQTLCGLAGTLNSVPSIGTGTWMYSGPATITFGNINAPNSSITSDMYGSFDIVWQETVANVCGSKVDTVQIQFDEAPVADAGLDAEACGLSYYLGAIPTAGSGVWTGPAGASFAPTANTPNAEVTSPAYGVQRFYWTESNGVCPISVDSVDITFNNQPAADAGADNQVCGLIISLNAIPTAGVGTWSNAGPELVSFTNVNDPNSTVTVPDYGEYHFKWTEINGSICTENSDQVTIHFFEQSVANAGPDSSVCGLSAGLKAIPSVGTGTWRGSGPGTVTFSNSSLALSGLSVSDYGTYEFIWSEVNGNCLTSEDTTLFTFYEQGLAQITAPDSICGTVVSLNAALSPGTFLWSFTNAGAGTFSAPTLTNTDFTSNAFGNEMLHLEVANGVCPVAKDSTLVSFLEAPIINAGVNDTICGLNTALTGSLNTGEFQWLAPGVVNFPSNLNSNYIGSGYGRDTIVARGFNTNICPISLDTIVVQFDQAPIAKVENDYWICGLDFSVKAVPSVGIGNWETIAPSTTLTKPDSSYSQGSGTSYGNFLFVWSETNGNVCPVSHDTLAVELVEVPQPNAGAPDTTCGKTISLSGLGTVGNYRWTSVNGGQSYVDANALNTNATSASFGSVTYILKGNNRGLCFSNDSVQVQFLQTPQSKAGLDKAFCGKEGDLAATPSVGTGSWTNLSGLDTVFSNTSVPNPLITVPNYGTYQFVWEENQLGFCADRDTVEIEFIEAPIANAGLADSICGKDINLAAIPSLGNGNWYYYGTENILFADPSSPTTNVTVDEFGKYDFVWEEVNTSTCPASTSTVSILFVATPTPNAGLSDSICGLSHTLNALAPAMFGQWSSADPEISFGNVNHPKSGISSTTYGDYTLVWTETNHDLCSATATRDIHFHEAPRANAGVDISICGKSVPLDAVTSVGSGTWSTGNADLTITDINDPFTNLSSINFGNYTMYWLEDNGSPCPSDLDSMTVSFLVEPIADAGADSTICGDSIFLYANPSDGIGTWAGTGPGTSVFTDLNDPGTGVDVNQFGSYQFEWTEDNGTCPPDNDFVNILFEEQSRAEAGPNDSICGLNISLGAIPSVGTGTWSFPGNGGINAIFSDVLNPATDVTVDGYGTHTFSWEEANGSSCVSSSDRVSISFYEQPIAKAGLDDSICGPNYTLAAEKSVGTGMWEHVGPGNAVFSDVSDPLSSVTMNVYGLHAFVWAESNSKFCAISRDTVRVRFDEQPVANAGIDTTICGPATQFNPIPSVGTGLWRATSPGITIIDANFAYSDVSVSTFGSYLFTWKEVNGVCPASNDTVQISFEQLPVTSAGTNDSICADTYGLSAAASVGQGTWTSVGPGTANFVDDQSASTNVAVDQFGDYQFIWSERNGNVCPVQVDTIAIAFYETPMGSVLPDFEVCGLATNLEGVASVGVGHWESDSLTLANANLATCAATANTYLIHQAVWIVANGGACPPDTSTLSIQFNPYPEVQITGDPAICFGDSLGVYINAAGNGPFSVGLSEGSNSYEFNNLTDIDSMFIHPTVNGTVVTNYIVDNSNPACTTLLGSALPFAVHALPQVNIPTDISLCFGDSALVEFDITGVGPFDIEYTDGTTVWNTTVGDDFNQWFTPDSSTTIWVNQIVDNNTPQCANTPLDSGKIYINSLPKLSLHGPNEICKGDTLQIEFELTGFGPWTVILTDGTKQYLFNNIVNGTTYDLFVADSVTITVDEFWDSSSPVCYGPGPDSLVINVLPIPNLEYSFPEHVCVGDNANIVVSPSGVSPFNIQYVFGLDTLWENNTNTLNLNPVITDTTDIQFLFVESSLGIQCARDLDSTIRINSIRPSSADLSGEDEVCFGDSVAFTLSGEGYFPMDVLISNGVDSNQTTLNSEDEKIWGGFASITGDFQIILISPNTPITCPWTESGVTEITVHEIPVVNFAALDSSSCPPLNAQIWNTTDAKFMDGRMYWLMNGEEPIFDEDTIALTFTESGSYDITLIVETNFGCVGSAVKSNFIEVYPMPKPDFDYQPNPVTIHNSKVQFTNLSEGATDFTWTIDSLVSKQVHPEYIFPFDQGGLYTVSLRTENSYGCVDSLIRFIEIEEELLVYIPNAFTPNYDGKNEVFKPVIQGVDDRNYIFSLYDRWGDLFYETTSPGEGWNGLGPKGNPAPLDVYVWKLRYKLKDALDVEELSGRVHLVR